MTSHDETTSSSSFNLTNKRPRDTSELSPHQILSDDSKAKRIRTQSPELSPTAQQQLETITAIPNNERSRKSKNPSEETRRSCPYLGTINRHVLDFDFEKLCSITLSNQRPYGCLVCGKFFQGRGKSTYAMTHALEQHHYLFINLHDTKVYCLPENYEVMDASLDDIKYHLNPTYTPKEAAMMATIPRYGKALDGTDFIPGCIGLNNLKETDYFNVIIQTLRSVIPLRTELLLLDLSHKQSPDPVLKSFSELIRKIFNPRNFKGIVSPHEFLQAVGVASNKRFRIGAQHDPLALLSWLLQRLHLKMKDRKTGNSIIHTCFQGKLQVCASEVIGSEESEAVESTVPFTFLTLKIPEAPIFKDALDRNVIPQMPIFDALQKFDGVTPQEIGSNKLQRYTIWDLPPYLIVHINRFSKNNFFLEKNPTIVTFPVKNLELKDYVHPDARDENPVTRYNLVANIVHEGKPHAGRFKCHIFHSATNQWYEMEDLRVVPTLPQMVALSESYVQVYQRQDVQPDGTISGQLSQGLITAE